MKKTLFTVAALALLLPGLQARTWTSADGAKTFEGELRSYDADQGMVSVILTNGRLLTFPQDKLSAADLTYLKEEGTKAALAAKIDPSEALKAQVVGSKVEKTKLHRMDGSRYKRAELDKAPEYYILYFSASW